MTKKTNPGKPFKPSPQTVLALQSLQSLVEDDAAWAADELKQLGALSNCTHRIDSLQQLSSYPSLIPSRTQQNLEDLVIWARDIHSIDLSVSGLRPAFLPDRPEDATLFATRTIPSGSNLITVPSSAILSSTLPSRQVEISALAQHGGPAIARSPSLTLTLILLMESYVGSSSQFAPYISALPSTLGNPFFSFCDDMKLYTALKPSSNMQASAVRMLRAQLRDYVGVFRAAMSAKLPTFPVSVMSLRNFRWAISVVMTRQNALPPKDPSPKSPPVMALVPIWDMFNHEAGRSTTAVTITSGDLSVECSAMREFNNGDAVNMCYGSRPSGQLALYSGFVPADGTPHDEVFINIPLYEEEGNAGGMPEKQMNILKARVLGKRGVSVNMDTTGGFKCSIPIGRKEDAIDRALGITGVVVMTKTEFSAFLKSSDVLPSPDSVSKLERAPIATQFVEKEITETLKSYHDPRDTDVDWNSPGAKLIEDLLAIETIVLENNFRKLQQFQQQQREINS